MWDIDTCYFCIYYYHSGLVSVAENVDIVFKVLFSLNYYFVLIILRLWVF